jgi:hypothetical protein
MALFFRYQKAKYERLATAMLLFYTVQNCYFQQELSGLSTSIFIYSLGILDHIMLALLLPLKLVKTPCWYYKRKMEGTWRFGAWDLPLPARCAYQVSQNPSFSPQVISKDRHNDTHTKRHDDKVGLSSLTKWGWRMDDLSSSPTDGVAASADGKRPQADIALCYSYRRSVDLETCIDKHQF